MSNNCRFSGNKALKDLQSFVCWVCFVLGPYPVMFRGCSWLCTSGITVSGAYGEAYGTSGIEPGWAVCKASTLPYLLFCFPGSSFLTGLDCKLRKTQSFLVLQRLSYYGWGIWVSSVEHIFICFARFSPGFNSSTKKKGRLKNTASF